jgi:feruloyl esterase
MFPPFLLTSLFLLYQTIQALHSPHWTFKSRCDAFTLPSSFNTSTFTVNVREFISANTTLLFPGNDASCNRESQIVAVDLCRIALRVETTKISGIVAELWLPEKWEGRVLGVGNGGIDGCELLWI